MRHIRNFTIITCLIISLLLGCLYLSGFIFVFIQFGPQYINPDILLPSFDSFPESIYPLIIKKYWSHWVLVMAKTGQLPTYSMTLFLSTFIPLSILGIVFFIFRAPILDWRPFKEKESVHGDARWADEKDIKKASLRSKRGMLLGRDKKGFLIADGYQHALLFAPTGSGKGVGFVIPNLLFWDDSVVVHDIKLENYELTSGYRHHKLKQKTYTWSPADPDGWTHCYNPIDWVSSKPGQMVDDVQKIANLIMPEKEFWNNEARSLFVGVVLYLLAVPEKMKSFGEVVRTMRSDDVVYNLAVVLDTIGKVIHPVAYMNIAAFLQKADKERSGVISTMNSSLELWANPLIDTATSSSDFNFMNFKKERTTVYVGLTPDNIQRLQPLMQVFYQQATEFLSRKIPNEKEEPYGVMFMMDEFPTLGKMEQFQTGIAYFRGYKVRLFLIIQDTEQLKGIYEEAGMNSFLSNSTYRVTFAANNMETANLISQLVGNKTADQESLNKPKFLDLNPAARSLHVSEVARALLLPQEVLQLPRDEQILLIESSPPIKSKKIFYFKDRMFKKRLLPPIPIPQQEPFDPRVLAEQRAKEKATTEAAKAKAQAQLDAQKAAEEAAKAAEEAKKLAPPPPAPAAEDDWDDEDWDDDDWDDDDWDDDDAEEKAPVTPSSPAGASSSQPPPSPKMPPAAPPPPPPLPKTPTAPAAKEEWDDDDWDDDDWDDDDWDDGDDTTSSTNTDKQNDPKPV